MGGVILFGLFVVLLVVLVTPALRARAAARREDRRQAAHDEVVRQLDDHRKRLPDSDRDKSDPD